MGLQKQTKFIPNYRLELWLCNGEGLDGVLQSEVEKIVDEASRDSSTRDMMRCVLAGSIAFGIGNIHQFLDI